MNRLIILMFVSLFLVAPLVSASDVYKQWTEVDLKKAARVSGAPSASLDCNITVFNPDNTVTVDFLQMTNQLSYHNYTLTASQTGIIGEYQYDIFCTDGSLNQTRSFNFEVTPSGEKNLLGFYFLIIILSYGVMGFGVMKKDITISLLGTFALFFLGIYVLFFGIDVFKNYLTNGFAIITLGVASYMGAIMAHEYIV